MSFPVNASSSLYLSPSPPLHNPSSAFSLGQQPQPINHLKHATQSPTDPKPPRSVPPFSRFTRTAASPFFFPAPLSGHASVHSHLQQKGLTSKAPPSAASSQTPHQSKAAGQSPVSFTSSPSHGSDANVQTNLTRTFTKLSRWACGCE